MFTVAVIVGLLLLALLVFPVTARSIAKPLLTIWWGNNLPRLFYQRQSDYCNDLIQLCSILTERCCFLYYVLLPLLSLLDILRHYGAMLVIFKHLCFLYLVD